MGVLVQVVDGVHGRPAVGLEARLITDPSGCPQEVANGTTDLDGVVPDWVDRPIPRGVHQIVFEVDRYFASLGVEPRFPRVVVVLRIAESTERYEIPLLITPHSFSTACGH